VIVLEVFVFVGAAAHSCWSSWLFVVQVSVKLSVLVCRGTVCCYLVFVAYGAWNIGFVCVCVCVCLFVCVRVWVVLFIYRLSLIVLYVWYFSNMCRCFPFLCVLMILMVCVIGPYLCPMCNMWVEYWELLLLFLIACLCSLYLVWNALPICSTYFCRQFNHFVWQTCFRYICPFVGVVSLCFVLFFVF
jgi:hypothetical protein